MTVEEPKIEAPVMDSRKPPRPAWRILLVLAVGVALALGYSIFTGLAARAKADTALSQETQEMSISTVSVVHPKVTAGNEEVVVPGNMQAFIDTPIWARASGYLKAWYVNIGQRVKQGELLATIEAPEVDQQLQQALAELATAQANLKLAEVTAERYTNLFKSDSVAKQDVDNAVQDAAAKTAAMNSAQANVSRLMEIVGYEKVLAPFNGVITARNVDVGSLVIAGANGGGKELFHLASTATLRVFVDVPEEYSPAVKSGENASLTLTEFPGRQFHGIVVRNANAIDIAARTLLVEVDVKNPTGELLPGSYVAVHLKLPSKKPAVTIPSNALLFRSEGLRTVVVENGRTELRPVVVGRDFGNDVEIVSGLRPNESVVVNPSDSVLGGEQVRIANGGTSRSGE